MFNRIAALTVIGVLISAGTAPLAVAQPPAPLPPPPPDSVPSGPPGILDTPDGWHIEVQARNETQVPVAPLTTAISSREYLVGGTFLATVTGSGSTEISGGTLEAGYQIGCGVLADEIEIKPQGGIGVNVPFDVLDAEIALGGEVDLLPGEVNIVDIAEKEFEGTETRVTIAGLRIKFDRCVGQSFIRSYATLSVSTEDTEDVITYTGVTKIV